MAAAACVGDCHSYCRCSGFPLLLHEAPAMLHTEPPIARAQMHQPGIRDGGAQHAAEKLPQKRPSCERNCRIPGRRMCTGGEGRGVCKRGLAGDAREQQQGDMRAPVHVHVHACKHDAMRAHMRACAHACSMCMRPSACTHGIARHYPAGLPLVVPAYHHDAQGALCALREQPQHGQEAGQRPAPPSASPRSHSTARRPGSTARRPGTCHGRTSNELSWSP